MSRGQRLPVQPFGGRWWVGDDSQQPYHGSQGDRMPQISSLIRTYTSQGAYEQDAIRLARLGYVVVTVIEEPAQSRWMRLLQRLFGSMPRRLIVTYSDAGMTSS
jgi:hypothetical protein